jgi:hypothetical protein
MNFFRIPDPEGMFFGEIFLRILVLLIFTNKTCSWNHTGKDQETGWFYFSSLFLCNSTVESGIRWFVTPKDSGSGSDIKHPGSATLIKTACFCYFIDIITRQCVWIPKATWKAPFLKGSMDRPLLYRMFWRILLVCFTWQCVRLTFLRPHERRPSWRAAWTDPWRGYGCPPGIGSSGHTEIKLFYHQDVTRPKTNCCHIEVKCLKRKIRQRQAHPEGHVPVSTGTSK